MCAPAADYSTIICPWLVSEKILKISNQNIFLCSVPRRKCKNEIGVLEYINNEVHFFYDSKYWNWQNVFRVEAAFNLLAKPLDLILLDREPILSKDKSWDYFGHVHEKLMIYGPKVSFCFYPPVTWLGRLRVPFQLIESNQDLFPLLLNWKQICFRNILNILIHSHTYLYNHTVITIIHLGRTDAILLFTAW